MAFSIVLCSISMSTEDNLIATFRRNHGNNVQLFRVCSPNEAPCWRPARPVRARRVVCRRMADGLLEAVRGLHLAHPELGPKPLLAKLRAQQPDLAAGNKEVREALAVLKAESKALEAAAAPAAEAKRDAEQT